MLQKLLINMRSIALSSSADEPSLLEELVDYVVSKYLTPNFAAYEYQNIDIDQNPLVSPAMIFVGAFIAIMLGASAVIFNKRVLGRLVRRILKNDALSPDRAMTLSELGFANSKKFDSRAIRFFINRMTLSKAVRCVEEDAHYGIEYVPVPPVDYSGKEDGEEPSDGEKNGDRRRDVYAVAMNTPKKLRYKRDPKKDHFYIPEHKRHHAAVRFDSKGTNPLSLIVLAAVYIILGIIFIRIFPLLMKSIDEAITAFKG